MLTYWFKTGLIVLLGFPSITTKPLKTRKFAGFGVFDSDIDSILVTGKAKYPYVLAELFPRKPKPKARYYIKFSAWDEHLSQLREKIIWIPSKIKTDKEKRVYAANEIAKINAALIGGKCFAREDTPTPEPIPAETPPKKILIISAIAEQLETKKVELRSKSGGTYKTVFGKFKKFVKSEGMEFNTLDSFLNEHAYLFRDYLIKTCKNSNRTANNNIIWIGALFKMAKDRKYITTNPFTGISPLPETDTEANVAFTAEHQEILEKWMQQNDPVLFLFTRFLYYAFIRPKELRQLKGIHLDLIKKTITVRGTIAKNKKTLTIPINKKLLELIGTKIDQLPNKFLFGKLLTWIGDTPCSENYAYNRHVKALKECGLATFDYTLYSWKHTGACKAIEAGVNPRKLQGLLRHSSLEETDTYLRSLGINLQNEELKEVW